MEIATAAEPEGGEGKWGELDEALAKADESAVLELGESAGFAGHEENFEAAQIAGVFVAAEGTREIGIGLKAGSEDDGIFNGEAGALAEVGADGMSGVAEDGDTADDPGKGGEAVLNFRADRVICAGNEFGDRSVPAGEKSLKSGGLGYAVRDKRVVGGGVPVDATGAEAKNADAGAAAIGFGEIAVVLEAEMV